MSHKDYLAYYGRRYEGDWATWVVAGFAGGINLVRDAVSAVGDSSNYLEINCRGITKNNFKEKLTEFRTTVLEKIKKYDSKINDISIECLLKNDNLDLEQQSKIAHLEFFNSGRGMSNSEFGDECRGRNGDGYRLFSKTQYGEPDEYNLALNSFEDLFTQDQDDMWRRFNKCYLWNNLRDSFRMVISKKGLKDHLAKKINICPVKGGRRRHSSRKYKNTINQVKYHKTRRSRRK